MQRIQQAIVFAITTLLAAATSATTIDFGAPGVTTLPYSENGLTFFTLPGPESAVVASGHLTTGTNFTPIHIRAMGTQPFDLTSVTIGNLFRPWRLESSSGAVLSLAATSTLDLSGQSGWSNIVYFDFIHDPAQANGGIQVNSLDFQISANSQPGDFNVDSAIDAADYVVWRNSLGTSNAYSAWRANFGQHFGSGSVANSAVPEPRMVAMLILAVVCACLPRHQMVS